MDADYLSLYDLQMQMKEGLEALFPERLWIKAEISAINARANGHCYLELSESENGVVRAKARAVIWRGRYYALSRYFEAAAGAPLQAGMQILARVQVSYSELYGLSLTIEEIEPQFTVGAAELERRRTIDRLREDGMLDRQRGLTLPRLPYSLAVISAEDAAGYGDFCRHLSENEYGFVFRVDLFPATMQGLDAPASITEALQTAETSGPYDAILIMRGGGSNLDLACFDDYSLALAIATCSVPVFTAIGHDRDYHVADMVAFSYLKTPTALADEIIGMYADEDERISSFSSRLRLAFLNKIGAMESRVELLRSRIMASDPRNILGRGYILATDSRGVVVKSAGKVAVGDDLKMMFSDGTLDVKVTGKK